MTHKPTVRDYRPGDRDRLVDFLQRVFAELGHHFVPDGKDSDVRDIDSVYSKPGGAFFVVDTDLGIGGCAGVRRFSDKVVELKRLYLAEELRGRGLGRELCSRAIHVSRRLGYDALRLDTTRRSTAALALFRDLGFREIQRYNDDEFADIFMEKALLAETTDQGA